MREALDGFRRILGDDDPSTLMAIANLGNLLHAQGDLATAEPLYREVLEGSRRARGGDHPDTLIAVSNLSALLLEQGRLTEAEPLAREALEGHRRVYGDVHPDTLWALIDMGYLLKEQGEHPQAEALYREAIEGSHETLGDDHPDTWGALRSLRSLFEEQGRLAEAADLQRQLLAGQRRALGDEDPDTLTSLSSLGSLLLAQDELAEAEDSFREALAGFRRVLGDEHPDTLTVTRNLAGVLELRLDAARPHGGDDSLARALASLGAFHLDLGAHQLAEQHLREAIETLPVDEAESDPLMWQVLSDLGMSIAAQDRVEEAEALLRESAEGLLAIPPSSSAPGDSYAAELGVAAPAEVVQRVIDHFEGLHELDPEAGPTAARRSGARYVQPGSLARGRGSREARLALQESGKRTGPYSAPPS